MNENKHELIIRRILVAVDTSPPSLVALEAAANVALRLQAELMGLFVEDVNLLKLARYPFASEIRYPKATIQRLDATAMEIQLRHIADQARAVLRESAEKRDLAWTFHVTRGVVASELLAAASMADLLVLGRMSRRLARASRVGSTAETAVSQTRRPVLLVRSDLDLRQPVLLIYDGSSAAHLAVAVAAALVQQAGTLRVLLWADDDQTAQAYRQKITAQLQDAGLNLEFLRLRRREKASDRLAEVDFGLIAVGDTGQEPSRSLIRSLLQETDYPILIVR